MQKPLTLDSFLSYTSQQTLLSIRQNPLISESGHQNTPTRVPYLYVQAIRARKRDALPVIIVL